MSNIQIEVGKKYKTREGHIKKITHRSECPNNPNSPYAVRDTHGFWWFGNGRASRYSESPNDLIEEVKENEMKIEVGKWYKSYYGGKVHIVHYNKDVPNPFFLDAFGNKYFEKEISEFLIEEWKEPKSGVAYINIRQDEYNTWAGDSHETRENANKQIGAKIIACVRIEWKEGQFDD